MKKCKQVVVCLGSGRERDRRQVVAGGRDYQKRREEAFGGDIYYDECGDSFLDVCISSNFSDCIF